MMSARLTFIPICVMFLTGCAHYEFNVVSPPDLRRHVGVERDTVFHLDPLEYRLRADENHLVVRIFNTSPDMIRLLGDQSSVVDPSGQSHPLRTQAIAPRAYLKFILPPMAYYQPVYGPTFGIGWGYGYGWHHHWYAGGGFEPYWYDLYWDEPRYVATYGEGGFWRWSGPGDVRLVLTFQRGTEKPFTQEWTFERVKS
jgi:hypothetical protein